MIQLIGESNFINDTDSNFFLNLNQFKIILKANLPKLKLIFNN